MNDPTNKQEKIEKQKQSIGVRTTTPLAFTYNNELYMERMNLLSAQGAGVLCSLKPDTGSIIPVAFRLSTAKIAIRCQATVLGHIPTTPQGFELHQNVGERKYNAVMGGSIADSATAIFRISDLESTSQKPTPKPKPPTNKMSGFCISFVNLNQEQQQAIEHHMEISRELSKQLSARGEHMVSLVQGERETVESWFNEGDLSKRALDW